MTLKNDLLLKALHGEPVERPPVWMMRQAGRYLPEYMVLREKYDFFTRVETPELAAEITLQPVDIVGVDAAILFSDILVVPQALGVEVQLIPGRGPVLPAPIATEAQAKALAVPDVQDRLHYVYEAIRVTQQQLAGRVPLIGFAGSPWTLLCYMVEGQGSKNFAKAKAFCLQQPAAAQHVLEVLTETTIAYLNAQVAAGANAVQVFDSWGGLLGPDDFSRWSLPYLKRIAQQVQGVPVVLFAKGAWHALPKLADTGAAALGIDWCIEPAMARMMTDGRVTLQGNYDPSHLLGTPEQIRQEVRFMLEQFGKQRYVANLGHGILPNVPVANAKAFVEAVKEFGPEAPELGAANHNPKTIF